MIFMVFDSSADIAVRDTKKETVNERTSSFQRPPVVCRAAVAYLSRRVREENSEIEMQEKRASEAADYFG